MDCCANIMHKTGEGNKHGCISCGVCDFYIPNIGPGFSGPYWAPKCLIGENSLTCTYRADIGYMRDNGLTPLQIIMLKQEERPRDNPHLSGDYIRRLERGKRDNM